MSSEISAYAAYEMIDRLTRIHPLPYTRNVSADGFERLYRASRTDRPISFEIADTFCSLSPSRIAIITGAFNPSFPNGENDGPIGAAVLARALASLGHRIVFPIENPAIPAMTHLARHLSVEAEIVPLAIESNPDAELAAALDAAIAIERTGVNPAGILHSGLKGTDITGSRANVDGIFEALEHAGKPTAGIGDGGNEIGFGKILSAAQDVFPHGRVCSCPCGQGNIARTGTAHFLPATVSNWGAYAVAAALAIRAGDASLAHTPELEGDLLQICMQEDVRDGVSGTTRFGVDGISGACSVGMVEIWRTIAEGALR